MCLGLVVLSTLLVIRLTNLFSKGFKWLGEDVLWCVVVRGRLLSLVAFCRILV